MHFFVDDIQACEPELIRIEDGVQVVIADDVDSMGLPRVCISCTDPTKLVEYVWDQWDGSTDPEWFADWVLHRIKCSPAEGSLASGIFTLEWDEGEENVLLVPLVEKADHERADKRADMLRDLAANEDDPVEAARLAYEAARAEAD